MHQHLLLYRLLADIADELERSGSVISPDKWLQIQALVQQLPEDTQPEQLRSLLAPLMAHTPEAQSNFYVLFDACLARARAVMQENPETEAASSVIDEAGKKASLWRNLAMVLTTLVIGGLAWAIWQWFQPPPPPPPVRYLYLNLPAGTADTTISLREAGDTARLVEAIPSAPTLSIRGGQYQVDSLGNLAYQPALNVPVNTSDSALSILYFTGKTDSVWLVVRTTDTIAELPPPVNDSLLQAVALPYPGRDIDRIKAPEISPTQLWLKKYEWPLKALLALLTGLLAWAILKWDQYRRAKVVAEMKRADRPPYIWQPDLGDNNPEWVADAVQPLLNQLRARTTDDRQQLDASATIQATSRRAGRIQFIYKQRTLPPDYLLLIDRMAWNDHRMRLFDALYHAFVKAEVPISRYFYDGDPRLCFSDAFPHGISLTELLHQHAEARLILVGEGQRLLSPISGKAAPWTNLLLSWKKTALLSPKPTQVWGRQEKALSELLPVLPASPQGLSAALDFFRADADSDLATFVARIQDAETQPVAFTNDLMQDLHRAYTPELVTWIAACAVWPALHWDLTCYLGKALSTEDKNLLTYANLRSLTRLPWFLEGRLPDGARAILLDHLEASGQEKQARAAIDQLIKAMPAPPEDAVAFDEYRMSLLLNDYHLRPNKERRQLLEKAFADYIAAGKKPDFIAFRLLEKPKSNLDALVTGKMKKYAFKHGLPGLGRQLWLRLFAIWAVLAAGVAVIPISLPECTDPVDYQDIALCLDTDEKQLIYWELLAGDAIAADNFDQVDSLRRLANELSPKDSAFHRNTATRYYNRGIAPYNCTLASGDNCPNLSSDSLLARACIYFTRSRALLDSSGIAVPIHLFAALDKAECDQQTGVDSLVQPPALFNLAGRVIDQTTNTVIVGATLIVEVPGSGDRLNLSTNSQGQYRLELPATALGTALRVTVQATDYETQSLQLTPAESLPDIRLTPSPGILDARAWAAAVAANTAAAYEQYLTDFPNGAQTAEARSRLQAMVTARDQAAWNQAEQGNTVAAYEKYLSDNANGAYRQTASDRINRLRDEEAWRQAQAANTPEACRTYLSQFPQGLHIAEAQACANPPVEKIVLPEMVFVAGGTFTMGCDDKRDRDCEDDEKPAHSVTLSDFSIGKYEVTNTEFAAFLNDYGSDAVKAGGTFAGEKMIYEYEWGVQQVNGRWEPAKGYERHPVVNVTWYGAHEYARWLSQKTGKNFRLPTEAEWEYAARGGQKSQGFLYSGSNEVGEVAWYDENSYDLGVNHPDYGTHPVGQKRANELNLYDMSGNVYEWCSDWYDFKYYSNSSGSNPKGPNSGSFRVYRGGSWFFTAAVARCAYRNVISPGFRYDYLGFRVAQALTF